MSSRFNLIVKTYTRIQFSILQTFVRDNNSPDTWFWYSHLVYKDDEDKEWRTWESATQKENFSPNEATSAIIAQS